MPYHTNYHLDVLTLHFEKDEIDWCRDLAKRIHDVKGEEDTVNSQNFYKNKPDWWRTFVGKCGEQAWSNYTGHPVDDRILPRHMGDDGTDFPGDLQVKASDTIKMPNLMFPVTQYKRKKEKKPKLYVLVWIGLYESGAGVGTILGEIKREDMFAVFKKDDFGYGLTYVVSNAELKQIGPADADRYN
jgi:hypothetical protein